MNAVLRPDAAAPLDALLGRVRQVAVFRALMLGDMLCAGPALRALRGRFPDARISLVGLPWAREWAQRLDSVDRFIEFPGYPALPERACDLAALPEFIADMQGERLDLALQLHGSGSVVNPLLATWGARRVAAFHEPGGWCPDPELGCPWPTEGTEAERLLALTDRLGAPRLGTRPDFPLRPPDRAEARALLRAQAAMAGLGTRRYACLHAGAQWESRRWPVARYAEVARALAAHGLTVVLTGTAGERALAQSIREAAGVPLVDLVGRTSLWTFGALLEGAHLLVCNDTGASHVAAALGTPSVVVSCGSDARRWVPGDPRLHRVLWADRPCRPCAHRVCPYGHECATDIAVPAVLRAVEQSLAAAR